MHMINIVDFSYSLNNAVRSLPLRCQLAGRGWKENQYLISYLEGTLLLPDHTTPSGCSVLTAGWYKPAETSSPATLAVTVCTVQHSHRGFPGFIRCPEVLRQPSHKGVQIGRTRGGLGYFLIRK